MGCSHSCLPWILLTLLYLCAIVWTAQVGHVACNGVVCNGVVCNGVVCNGVVCNGVVCNGVWFR